MQLQDYSDKPLASCTDLELFNALMRYTTAAAEDRGYNEGKKKLYYISAEFLVGKLLSNNLINLGLYDAVSGELAAAGKSLAELEEYEHEPSLGNGGLGRLAACFLDSLATLGLPADGVGLAYHCGLFRQVFEWGKQAEVPDLWLKWGRESFLKPTGRHYTVHFGGFDLTSTMYEIDVTGYGSKCGRLRLFDVDSVDESVLHSGIGFDKQDIAKNLTLFLYPDDCDDAGRLLRVYQEYFMVANAAQLLLDEAVERGSNLHDLADYAQVQINDTHPTMVIPELIRLLMERGIAQDEATRIVGGVCSYTNHTILAEALETWPLEYLEKVVPQLVPYIKELDRRVREKFDDESVYIIDKQNKVHMAFIDIHYGFSVNGVAAIHTQILEQTELNNFYKLYPGKFNNKTNGITFRRWLLCCNRELADFISSKIGDGYKKDADRLEGLLEYRDDEETLEKLGEIKQHRKNELTDYIARHEEVNLDPNGIFDIQVKRLHEYKRQQMNALYIIHKYLEIKRGIVPKRPINFIFGAKAAPAYIIAQDIIHVIKCLQEIIDNDPDVNKYIHLVMVTNYNVTYAEKLIPAADVSEQISLASKEASGTSNMKFMLNGAVTLGTSDGANVEIHDLVGDDNIYMFGINSETVINHYKNHDYVSRDYYEKSPVIREAVDFLVGPEMMKVGRKENLERLYNDILNKDWFMALIDLEDYIRVKDKMFADYEDRCRWEQMCLTNIAKSGFFSSDRTIREYNRDIWHLDNSPAPYVK